MSKRSIEDAHDPDLRGSLPALRRAALRAREIARKTGTTIVIWRNNRIEHLKPDHDTANGNIREEPGRYPDNES